MRSRSTRRPASASSAGSSVTDAATTTATARLAEIATPYRKETPVKASPKSEMTTVAPATITLRPAVETASTTASRTSDPPTSAVRKRVRTSSA